ncbi:alpha-hydroxy acid oxidase [Micromonospora sp. NPDC049102]|uniref:alpha-hydroxy acid oxidase n=1 Tax=Micromonospora sp. NPDC049102 TaxID=3364265 RepID=UPI00371628C5
MADRATDLAALLCLDDVAVAARRVLAEPVWDYVAGGSGTESTLRDNRDAFDRVHLVPRVLAGTDAYDLGTELLGTPMGLPVGVAPMAYQRLLHPDGEVALAEAARDEGAVFVASMLSSEPIERIAATQAAVWMQLYWLRDRGLVADLVTRAEAAGCRALMLTVDVPRMGRRLRDMRSGFTLPDDVVAANLPPAVGAAAHSGSAHSSALMVHTGLAFDPKLSWRDLDWLRRRTRLPIVVKGVLHPDDAVRAADLGVDGVVVSNHGGRQLDGAVPSIAALEPVVAAVADRCAVLVDSGVRSGVDVARALALGASAVLVGRPALWGLAVGGRAGARRVLSLLRTELEDAMAMMGCADLRALGHGTTVAASGSGSTVRGRASGDTLAGWSP